MISVLTNNFRRLLCQKMLIVVTLALTVAAIMAAVLISSMTQSIGKIALVADDEHAVITTPYLCVTLLDKVPPISQMVSGRYDAVVVANNDGTYAIQTIRSDEFRLMLEAVLLNPTHYDGRHLEGRRVGANIIGYLLMFILLEGVLLMYMFAEDKEKKQIVRIAASPVRFAEYLSAHCLFTFGFIFVSTMFLIYLVKVVAGADIGFSLGQYAGLIALICVFATAFPLFINSLASNSDTANMVGSSIVVLTTILAGSFYSFEKGNAVLEVIISVLPQTAYLSLVEKMEKGMAMAELWPQALYVLLLALVLFCIATVKTRRDYVRSN